MDIPFDIVLVKKYWNRLTYKTSRYGAIAKLKKAYFAANALEGDERIDDYGEFIELWKNQSEHWRYSDSQMLKALTNFMGRLGFSYELTEDQLAYEAMDGKANRLDVSIDEVRDRIAVMSDPVAANILMLASCGFDLDHILTIDGQIGDKVYLTTGKVIQLAEDEISIVETVLASADAIDAIRSLLDTTGNPSNDRNVIYNLISRRKSDDNFPWTYGDVLHIWEIHTATSAGESAMLVISYRLGVTVDTLAERFAKYLRLGRISSDTYNAMPKVA